MSCCIEPTLTKAEFLSSKLKNFRAFVEPYCLTDQQRAALDTYKSLDSVMPFLLQAVAAQRVGQADAVVEMFCKEFPTADDAFKTKIGRYFSMFCDVLST